MKLSKQFIATKDEIFVIIRSHFLKFGLNINDISIQVDNDEFSFKMTTDEEVVDFNEITSLYESLSVENQHFLLTNLRDLDLSVRSYNSLAGAGVKNLGELFLDYKKTGWLNGNRTIRNFGTACQNEIKELFKQKGLIS